MVLDVCCHVLGPCTSRCLSSTALSDDDEGLPICASSLRNLSTATSPRSLRGERAAACFRSAYTLLARCPDHEQVSVDCAVAMANFIDASHQQDLQVMGLNATTLGMCVRARVRVFYSDPTFLRSITSCTYMFTRHTLHPFCSPRSEPRWSGR